MQPRSQAVSCETLFELFLGNYAKLEVIFRSSSIAYVGIFGQLDPPSCDRHVSRSHNRAAGRQVKTQPRTWYERFILSFLSCNHASVTRISP